MVEKAPLKQLETIIKLVVFSFNSPTSYKALASCLDSIAKPLKTFSQISLITTSHYLSRQGRSKISTIKMLEVFTLIDVLATIITLATSITWDL